MNKNLFRERKVLQALLAYLAKMASPDHPDSVVFQVVMVLMASLVPLAMQGNTQKVVKKATMAPLENEEILVRLVQPRRKENQAEKVLKGHQAHLALTVHLAQLVPRVQ